MVLNLEASSCKVSTGSGERKTSSKFGGNGRFLTKPVSLSKKCNMNSSKSTSYRSDRLASSQFQCKYFGSHFSDEQAGRLSLQCSRYDCRNFLEVENVGNRVAIRGSCLRFTRLDHVIIFPLINTFCSESDDSLLACRIVLLFSDHNTESCAKIIVVSVT